MGKDLTDVLFQRPTFPGLAGMETPGTELPQSLRSEAEESTEQGTVFPNSGCF